MAKRRTNLSSARICQWALSTGHLVNICMFCGHNFIQQHRDRVDPPGTETFTVGELGLGVRLMLRLILLGTLSRY